MVAWGSSKSSPSGVVLTSNTYMNNEKSRKLDELHLLDHGGCGWPSSPGGVVLTSNTYMNNEKTR